MSGTIKVALDWTPNPLHSGFFVAQATGIYAKAGLSVRLISPSDDNYATTPAKKLANGEVDFCLCPSESIISFNTTSPPVPIKAVAALLNRDASAIISRTAKRPAELVGFGKRYASYGARYEDAIVQTMIDNDTGGKGQADKLATFTPAKLGIWDTVVKGEADSTWIFEPYEGVQARREGHNFSTFRVGDYGIPYGYSPTLAYNPIQHSGGKENSYRSFLTATAQGYAYAMQNVSETAHILREAMLRAKLTERDTDINFLRESQQAISSFYNVDASTGHFQAMDQQVWENFLSFLRDNGLLKGRSREDVSVAIDTLFTNDLL